MGSSLHKDNQVRSIRKEPICQNPLRVTRSLEFVSRGVDLQLLGFRKLPGKGAMACLPGPQRLQLRVFDFEGTLLTLL